MIHFQTPNTQMSTAKLLELRELLDRPVSQEVFFRIVTEIDRGLLRSSPQYSDLHLSLQKLAFSNKQTDLITFIETKLISEPSTSSDILRKKRRQTPRRRYTFKKHRSEKLVK